MMLLRALSAIAMPATKGDNREYDRNLIQLATLVLPQIEDLARLGELSREQCSLPL